MSVTIFALVIINSGLNVIAFLWCLLLEMQTRNNQELHRRNAQTWEIFTNSLVSNKEAAGAKRKKNTTQG